MPYFDITVPFRGTVVDVEVNGHIHSDPAAGCEPVDIPKILSFEVYPNPGFETENYDYNLANGTVRVRVIANDQTWLDQAQTHLSSIPNLRVRDADLEDFQVERDKAHADWTPAQIADEKALRRARIMAPPQVPQQVLDKWNQLMGGS